MGFFMYSYYILGLNLVSFEGTPHAPLFMKKMYLISLCITVHLPKSFFVKPSSVYINLLKSHERKKKKSRVRYLKICPSFKQMTQKT
jgi:hypothetical protein